MVLKRSSPKLAKSLPSSKKLAKKEMKKKIIRTTKGKKVQKKAVEQPEVGSKKSTRPIDEVVVYPEIEFQIKELIPDGNRVLIGPPTLTRFERARITGARSLQLSLGAPSLISWTDETRDTISIATAELDSRALPISIRRILPNGLFQDIPVDWLK